MMRTTTMHDTAVWQRRCPQVSTHLPSIGNLTDWEERESETLHLRQRRPAV